MRPYRFGNELRERPLLQLADMRELFPQFRYSLAGAGAVVWRGCLQPTESSPVYAVKILHEVWKHPRVWVVSPPLVTNAPHVYRSDDNALCLYYPPQWRWTPNERLAATIVPWTAFWLYYYEAWLVTGDWLGPSSHREPGAKESAA